MNTLARASASSISSSGYRSAGLVGWSLERQVQTKQEDGTVGTRPQYCVYVLEAKLAFADGMTILSLAN